MKKTVLSLAGLAALFCAASVSAADLTAGKATWEKLACASCHGEDAKSSILPTYPILAGQHEDFLRQSLRGYKLGQAGAPPSANIRKNAVMGAMAAQLSDADIRNLAAWLSSLPSPLGVRR